MIYLSILYIFVIILFTVVRMNIGPWYHITNPSSIQILNGYPVSWEANLFTKHYTAFLSDDSSIQHLTEVQLRAFIPLSLSSILSFYTRESYWSTHIIEIIGWSAAAVGTTQIARMMNAPRHVGIVAGLLVTGSPLFVSQISMHVMHLFEFSSMCLGIIFVLWFENILPEINLNRFNLYSIFYLSILPSSVLFVLSHIYVYQSIIFIILVIIGVRILVYLGRYTFLQIMLFVMHLIISYILYRMIDSLFLNFLTYNGVNIHITGTEIGGDPLRFFSNLGTTLSDHDMVYIAYFFVAKCVASIELIINSFGIVAIIFISLGLFKSPFIMKELLVLLNIIVSLIVSFYHTPWVAMSSYPIMYIAAANGIRVVSKYLLFFLEDDSQSKRYSITRLFLYCICVIFVLLSTNLDIFGNNTFMKNWWHLYSETFPS